MALIFAKRISQSKIRFSLSCIAFALVIHVIAIGKVEVENLNAQFDRIGVISGRRVSEATMSKERGENGKLVMTSIPIEIVDFLMQNHEVIAIHILSKNTAMDLGRSQIVNVETFYVNDDLFNESRKSSFPPCSLKEFSSSINSQSKIIIKGNWRCYISSLDQEIEKITNKYLGSILMLPMSAVKEIEGSGFRAQIDSIWFAESQTPRNEHTSVSVREFLGNKKIELIEPQSELRSDTLILINRTSRWLRIVTFFLMVMPILYLMGDFVNLRKELALRVCLGQGKLFLFYWLLRFVFINAIALGCSGIFLSNFYGIFDSRVQGRDIALEVAAYALIGALAFYILFTLYFYFSIEKRNYLFKLANS